MYERSKISIGISCTLVSYYKLKSSRVWSFLTPVYAFILVPILELLSPVNDTNISNEEKQQKATLHWTDFLLYLNIFLVFGIISPSVSILSSTVTTLYETIGLIFSCGIVIGSNGINVAHELGHRISKLEQFLGKLLLLPALYMHYFIEHNFGQHLHPATQKILQQQHTTSLCIIFG